MRPTCERQAMTVARRAWSAIRAPLLGSCIAGALATGLHAAPDTATPIKHLVVLFQENVSFDHYFGTYPNAQNLAGEPPFRARAGTPEVNTLETAGLLHSNPNKANPENGDAAAAPFRLSRAQAASADQNHGYTAEQAAFDEGEMDLFPTHTGRGSRGGEGRLGTKGQVMGYFDGNTVTALWNYAQSFAMNDNSFSTTFGPSTPGAINFVSGQTNGVILPPGAWLEGDGTFARGRIVPDGQDGWTMIANLDPTGDACSVGKTVMMSGPNIGDMMNQRGISWGWFQGGFDLSRTNSDGSSGCRRSTTSEVTKANVLDYVPHHAPFQYYASTANPTHQRPSSIDVIGSARDGGANHQYDLHDFFDALDAGILPAVSFLKSPGFQDGHAGYSDPLDEQDFIVAAVNAVSKSPFWSDTAIIILYDDSDGWYDHAHAVINPSNIPVKGYDVLNGDSCGPAGVVPLPGVKGLPVQGRCGYGTRQPFLVISPYARSNHVDHTLTDQTSVLRFIEDNWMGGTRLGAGSFDAIAGSIEGMFDWSQAPRNPLFLDPVSGVPVQF